MESELLQAGMSRDLSPDQIEIGTNNSTALDNALRFDEAALDNLVEGLYTTDRDGLLVTMNPAAEKLLGWKLEELRGRLIHEVVHHMRPDGTTVAPASCEIQKVLSTGTPRIDVDDQFVRKDGTFIDVRYSSSPLVDSGHVIGLVVVFRDVSERRRIENKIRESEARFRAMFTQAGVGVCLIGPDCVLEKVNPKFCEIVGFDESQLIGRTCLDITHDAEREETSRIINSLLETDVETASIENRYIRKDGAAIWVRINLAKIIEAGSRAGQLVAIVEDINERKLAQDRLRESEQTFARFMQHLPGLAWIKDGQGRYIYANEAAERAFGVSGGELYGRSDAEIFSPRIAAAFVENDKRALESESGIQTVEMLETGSGEVIESLVSKFTITGDRDHNSLVGGMAIDVTAQRQSQRDQEFLFAVAEMIRAGRQPADLLGTIARLVGEYLGVHRCLFNEIDLESDTETVHSDYFRSGRSVAGVHRISDYSREMSEIMMSGKTVVNRDSKTDPRTAELYEKVYRRTKERAYVSVPMLRGGKWVASLWCSDDRPRNWAAREIALLETIAERTWAAVERVRAEAAVRASEEKYRNLFESIDEGFVIVEMIFDRKGKPVDYRFLDANPSFAKLTGLPEDALGKTARQLVPDLENQWFEIFGKVAKTGESVRFENKSDAMGRWFDVYASRIGDASNARVAIVFNNVTQRKLAESALRESEERFLMAQSAGNVGVWDWDLVANRTYWSDTMWSFYGEVPSTDVNPDDAFWSAHLHPDDHDRVKEHLYRSISSRDLQYKDEFRIIGAEERIIWIASMANIVRDKEGRAIRIYGVNVDITERKLNEERLRRNEMQLRLVTDSLPALIAYIDNKKRYQFVNGTYSEWFGHQPADLIGRPIRDVLGARAFETLKPLIEKALSGETVSMHTEIHYKNIGTKFIHLNYVPDIADDGTVRGFFSLISDLTEMKRSEELLRSTEEKMALLMENVADYAIFSTDTKGNIESWNIGAEKIFGYSADEIIGRSGEILYTAEDAVRGVHRNEMRVARQKGRATDERWYVRKDGTRFFANGVMMPLIVGQRLTGYAKIAGDLTEKKRSAEALQTAHDELELRVFQRTRELGEMNELLRREVEQRKLSEKHRVKLLHRIVSAQEAERKRIARDIHDQLGQRLTALRLKLASLHDVYPDNKLASARVERLQEIASLLDSEVSFLASELRPSVLDDLGLEEALRAYTRDWSNHFDITLKFHSNGLVGKRYGREAETQIYRIAQEALNNVAKHAGPAEVTVLAEQSAEFLVLIIEDSGSGFDVDERPGKSQRGLGLVGMRERATLIGATLEIESGPGQGTTIFLRLPNRKRGQTHG